MTLEALRQLYEASPFVPFEMVLADGRSLGVPHPDFLALPQSHDDPTVTFYQLPDFAEIIDLLLVISLRYRETELDAQVP